MGASRDVETEEQGCKPGYQSQPCLHCNKFASRNGRLSPAKGRCDVSVLAQCAISNCRVCKHAIWRSPAAPSDELAEQHPIWVMCTWAVSSGFGMRAWVHPPGSNMLCMCTTISTTMCTAHAAPPCAPPHPPPALPAGLTRKQRRRLAHPCTNSLPVHPAALPAGAGASASTTTAAAAAAAAQHQRLSDQGLSSALMIPSGSSVHVPWQAAHLAALPTHDAGPAPMLCPDQAALQQQQEQQAHLGCAGPQGGQAPAHQLQRSEREAPTQGADTAFCEQVG